MKEEGWQVFLELCLRMKSGSELEDFFNLIMTMEEKKLLASRCKIIKALLAEEMSQREMAKQYKVSIGQITRGSNALKVISQKMKDFMRSLL